MNNEETTENVEVELTEDVPFGIIDEELEESEVEENVSSENQ